MRRNPGDREFDHATQRVSGPATLAQALAERHAADRIAEPAHHTAQNQVPVLDAVDGLDHHAVEQHAVGAAGLDLNIAERVEKARVETRGDAVEPRHGRFIADALPRHDLEARAPLLSPDQE